MFFLVYTNFSPAERGVGGWKHGEGWEGAQTSIQLCLEQEKPPKVATLSPYHTTRSRRNLANDGNSSRSWPDQLVPSIGTILLTMTSQGWQNALQKSRSAHIRQWRHCA